MHQVAATRLDTASNGRDLAVRVAWWSGVEPCTVLAGVDVARDGNTFTLTVREGSGAPPDTACIEIAQYKATIVDLGELEPGTYTVTAFGDAPPVTVTIDDPAARRRDDRSAARFSGLTDTPPVNLFDLFAVIILVTAILAGIRTGALPQVGGVVGAIGGLLLILALAPLLLGATGTLEPIPRALAVLGPCCCAVALGEAIGPRWAASRPASWAGASCRAWTAPRAASSGRSRRCSSCGWPAGCWPPGRSPALGRAATPSVVVRGVDQVLPPPTVVVGQIAGALDASGLPDVFVGLDPLPLPAVDTPTDPQAARIAASAVDGTARITDPGLRQPGQRHRRDRGARLRRHERARRRGRDRDPGHDRLRRRRRRARPVRPEPRLAVLHVPGLDGRALRFATSVPERGATGAALGYAGGGSLAVLPAAVAGAYEAIGHDIYDGRRSGARSSSCARPSSRATRAARSIFQDGTVGGLVFAESRTDPEVGYALCPVAIATRVRRRSGRTGVVDVGRCID